MVKTGGKMTISKAKTDMAKVMEQRKQRREQLAYDEDEYYEGNVEEFEELDLDNKNDG